MAIKRKFELNTGGTVPTVAFGTYGDPKKTYDAVLHALKFGYRHIDTARHYQNEEEVGKAIKDSGVPREEIFLTTKVWNTEHRDVRRALDDSLARLGVDYLDLLLMHWPVSRVRTPDSDMDIIEDSGVANDDGIAIHEVWQQFQELPKEKVRAIGVSNFTSTRLQHLIEQPSTTIKPAVNQCEFHPLLPQQKLVTYCLENDIVPEAFCPIAHGELDHPTIKSLSKKYGVNEAQIALSWNVLRGVAVLPKSFTPCRIESNYKLVELTKDEQEAISAIGAKDFERMVEAEERITGDMDVFENNIDCK